MTPKLTYADITPVTGKFIAEELRKWASEASDIYPEETSEGKVKIQVYADPMVAKTYAARVTFGKKKENHIDFLFVGDEYEQEWLRTGEQPAFDEQLEECEFDTWPPVSSEAAMARSIFL